MLVDALCAPDSADTLLQTDICQVYAGSLLSIRINFRLI